MGPFKMALIYRKPSKPPKSPQEIPEEKLTWFQEHTLSWMASVFCGV